MTKQADRHNKGKVNIAFGVDALYALVGKARVKTFGATKYGVDNWRKGLPWRATTESMLRHTFLYLLGQDHDAETGELHIDHVQCNAEFLSEYWHTHPGMDDRTVNTYTDAQKAQLAEILAGDAMAFFERNLPIDEVLVRSGVSFYSDGKARENVSPLVVSIGNMVEAETTIGPTTLAITGVVDGFKSGGSVAILRITVMGGLVSQIYRPGDKIDVPIDNIIKVLYE